MPKKKTARKVVHRSFKLTPHGQPTEKVVLYIVVAIVVGLSIGYLLKGQVISAMGY